VAESVPENCSPGQNVGSALAGIVPVKTVPWLRENTGHPRHLRRSLRFADALRRTSNNGVSGAKQSTVRLPRPRIRRGSVGALLHYGLTFWL